MKTPHLATALLAASSIVGGTANLTIEIPAGSPRAKFAPRTGGSQRQLRKDRRRAHAAGIKNAYRK